MPSHHHEHDVHEHDEHEHHHQESTLLINNEDQHNMNMWKGLVAMMGLVMFFFTEKALTMLAEWRKHRQRRNKVSNEGCLIYTTHSIDKITVTCTRTGNERNRWTKQQRCW